jgi:HEAT repeat protein
VATDFESRVLANWSQAVFAASRDLPAFRTQLLSALASAEPEVRSAAVAALYEADDRDAHDAVFGLVDDPEEVVRHEVLEYLSQFAAAEDAPKLFELLASSAEDVLGVTTALRRAMGVEAGLLTGEESPDVKSRVIAHWQALLEDRGLLNRPCAG